MNRPHRHPLFRLAAFVGVLFLITTISSTFAYSNDNKLEVMQQQIEALLERVELLEERNAELEMRLHGSEAQIESASASIGELSEKVYTVSDSPADASGKQPILSKFGAELYGYIKLDSIYNTSRMHAGNYAMYVKPIEPDGEQDEFHITANQTRLGLNLHGPDVLGGVSSGRVEVDFYGGGDQNKSRLRMRHAYGQVYWPEYDFSFLAGQTTEVVSPLWPKTIDFLIGRSAGNIGFRIPQLRLTKGFDISSDSRLELQAAMTRTIGDDFGGVDTGADSGFPTMQSRLAYSFPLLTDKQTTIGVSGHYGSEKYATSGIREEYDTWSVNMDFTIPLIEKLAFTGELWHGENLDSMYGGIMQGVNRTTGDAIPASGGWGALTYGPWKQFSFNVGGGVDDPKDRYIEPLGRLRNHIFFGNVLYEFNENLAIGMELSYWETRYKDMKDADALRLQSSILYRF